MGARFSKFINSIEQLFPMFGSLDLLLLLVLALVIARATGATLVFIRSKVFSRSRDKDILQFSKLFIVYNLTLIWTFLVMTMLMGDFILPFHIILFLNELAWDLMIWSRDSIPWLITISALICLIAEGMLLDFRKQAEFRKRATLSIVDYIIILLDAVCYKGFTNHFEKIHWGLKVLMIAGGIITIVPLGIYLTYVFFWIFAYIQNPKYPDEIK